MSVYGAMPRTPYVELFINGMWTTVTSHAFQRAGVKMKRGRADVATRYPPGTAALELDNSDGDYSPRDPLSSNYDLLGRNTPMRCGLTMVRDAFARTTVNGWGSTDDTALAYTLTGTAADFDTTPGVGTVNVPAATDIRLAYLQSVNVADVELRCTFTVPVADVTGGSVVAGGLLVRMLSSTDFYYVRVEIATDETVTIGFRHATGTVIAAQVLVPGLTHVVGQAFTVMCQVEGETVRAKVWHVADGEPYDWQVTASEVPRRKGWVGVRTALAGGSTNGPLVVSYTDITVRVPRFCGEVASWPQQRDRTGLSRYVDLDVGGLMRRLNAGKNVQSTLRRYIPSTLYGPTNMVAYWPLEEASRTVSKDVRPVKGAGSIGYVPPVTGTTPGRITWGGDKGLPGSLQAPVLTGGGSLVAQVQGTLASGWSITWAHLMSTSSGSTSLFATRNDTIQLSMVLDSATPTVVNIYLTAPGVAGTLIMAHTYATAADVDGVWHTYAIRAQQNGTQVEFFFDVDGQLANTSNSWIAAGQTLKELAKFQFSSPPSSTAPTAVSHVAIFTQDTFPFNEDIYEAAFGWTGETAGRRIERLCTENGIPFYPIGDLDGTARMGPQRVDTLLNTLFDCARADIGTLYETRGTLGLSYRTRSSLYNQDAMVTIDYSAHQLQRFTPVEDDQGTRNDVTAKRDEGGEFQAELSTGRMSVLEPSEGGVGRYDGTYTCNVESDLQLPDVAGWVLAAGTVDEPRFPAIEANFANLHVLAAPDVAAALLDMDIDDRLVVTDAAAVGFYDDISQIVRGYVETLNTMTHSITAIGVPEVVHQTMVVDTSDGKLDSSSSYLLRAINSSETAIPVASTAEKWTTDAAQMPIMVKFGGEVATVTVIAAPAPALVAAGTAAHADNASVMPGIPAGIAAGVGQVLFLFAAIRNSGTGVPVTPSGFLPLVDMGNAMFYAKYVEAADVIAMPTVAFTGGVAGATCSAQAAVFTGISIETASGDAATSLNSSAQNIAYPATILRPYVNHLLITLGWKQDDWTSVATLASSTEIGEPSSVLGSDQGLVWDYQVLTASETRTTTAGSFVVTGGANAISRGGVIAFTGTQVFTMTRSANSVVKPHAAGTRLSLARRATLAL